MVNSGRPSLCGRDVRPDFSRNPAICQRGPSIARTPAAGLAAQPRGPDLSEPEATASLPGARCPSRTRERRPPRRGPDLPRPEPAPPRRPDHRRRRHPRSPPPRPGARAPTRPSTSSSTTSCGTLTTQTPSRLGLRGEPKRVESSILPWTGKRISEGLANHNGGGPEAMYVPLFFVSPFSSRYRGRPVGPPRPNPPTPGKELAEATTQGYIFVQSELSMRRGAAVRGPWTAAINFIL